LLTVSKTGDGVGTVSVPGWPAAPIARALRPGSNVNLSATIALGLDLCGWAGCDYRGAGRDVRDEHEWDKTLTVDFDALILAPSNPSISFRVLHTTRLI